jgi:hypothetical protein
VISIDIAGFPISGRGVVAHGDLASRCSSLESCWPSKTAYMMPPIGPGQYALNASGKEAIKLGSMSALGPKPTSFGHGGVSASRGKADIAPTGCQVGS